VLILVEENKEYLIFSRRITLNILMIHPHDLYSSAEPWTVRIKNLGYEFIKKGHQVKLVYFPIHRKDARKILVDGQMEVISLDRSLGLHVLLKNTLQMLKLADWSDIIHFQKCYYHAALPALIAAWIKDKHIHYDWDDWETKIFYYSNPKNLIVGEFINIFEKLLPKAVDTISVSSNYLRSLCLKMKVSPERISQAPVGADLQRFRPDPALSGRIRRKYSIKNLLVLYVGQLHGGQYAELFIKSAKIILQKRQDVTFIIVGDGYRAPELKTLTRQEGLGDSIIFTGAVAHEEIPIYIADADVCVACFEENDITRCKSPLKLAEYLSSGKAIVASNVGEVRNMVGGVGILVEPGRSDTLAEGILRLLSDKSLRDKLSVLARKRAESKYNWTTTAASLISAYSKGAMTD